MPMRPARCLVPTLVLALGSVLIGVAISRSAEKAEPQLAHMVFFTLKDHSTEARERFVASCWKYLSQHEGTVAFSIGTIAEDVVEPAVSVRDFDMALHVIFANKAAERGYLEHPRHKQFVAENKDGFAQVRVFDSYLSKPLR